MSNDELQKAIDDITQSDAGMAAPVTPIMSGDDNDNGNDQLADEFSANVVPEPKIGEAVSAEPTFQPPVAEFNEAPAEPEVKQEIPEEAEENAAPETPVEEVKEEPKFEASTGEVDLEEVKKNALRELYPLLKNMNINPEQAFEICKEVAKDGEKGAIKEAFEAAKKISDDSKRADALLEIVEMINK